METVCQNNEILNKKIDEPQFINKPYFKDITLDTRIALTANQKKAAKEKLDAQYKEESKLVKGMFKNIEAPGGNLEFAYRKYPQDPLRIYTFEDNKEYEVPLDVAKHINNNCVEEGSLSYYDSDGNMLANPKKHPDRQRYQFISREFY